MDDHYFGAPKKKKKKKALAGWYFPPEIVSLFRQGLIGPRDLVVLGVINSLTKTYGDGSTLACFASNRYIGKLAQINPTHTGVIISKLVTVGALYRTFKDGEKHATVQQRYLLPVWRVEMKRGLSRKRDGG